MGKDKGMEKGIQPLDPNNGVTNIASTNFSNTTQGVGGGKNTEKVGPGENKLNVKVRK